MSLVIKLSGYQVVRLENQQLIVVQHSPEPPALDNLKT
jgi:hypothetical protein